MALRLATVAGGRLVVPFVVLVPVLEVLMVNVMFAVANCVLLLAVAVSV